MRDPNKALLIDEKEIRCLHPWKLGRAKSQDCSETILAGFYQSSPCRFLPKQFLPVSTKAILAGFYQSNPCRFLPKQSLPVSTEAVLAGFYGSNTCRFLRKQFLPVLRNLFQGFTETVLVGFYGSSSWPVSTEAALASFSEAVPRFYGCGCGPRV